MLKKGGENGKRSGEEKESRNKKIRLTCPDCESDHIITDEHHGEIICEHCGLVIEERLYDFGAEHRAYNTEERVKKERAGTPLKFSKQFKGLTTEIDRYDRDIRGRALPVEKIAQIHRMRTWHKRTRLSESSERNLSLALGELDRMCSCLSIPNNIKEDCAKLYRKVLTEGLVKGRSIESSVAAVIYFISREHHAPKTLKELEDVSGVGKRDIGRTYNYFCKKMGLKSLAPGAEDYVHRFACKLGLSGEVEAKALELLKSIKIMGITSGRSPVSIAAAVIYFASGMPFKELSCKIQEVGATTLKKRCKELARELKLELNEKL